MRTGDRMEYVALAARMVVGVVFLAAAVSKIRKRAAREAFRTAVTALVPNAPARPLAVAVVATEFAVVLLVAVPQTAAAGLALAAAALAAFTVALWAALRRGVRAACRCFGWSAAPVSRAHLVRNAVLLAVALAGAVGAVTASTGTLHAGGVAVSAGAAIVLILAVAFADDLAFLWSSTT